MYIYNRERGVFRLATLNLLAEREREVCEGLLARPPHSGGSGLGVDTNQAHRTYQTCNQACVSHCFVPVVHLKDSNQCRPS